MSKNPEPLLCLTTVVNRPKRKIMIMRAKKAYDYWSFCEEKGCEWEGSFNSIRCKLDKAAIIELQDTLVLEGTTKYIAGVELPIDYDGTIPSGCECIDINSCDMMYFQSKPFDNDDDYGVDITSVMKAIEKYDYKKYGYEINMQLAPKFNYGASKEEGARIAVPVVTGT